MHKLIGVLLLGSGLTYMMMANAPSTSEREEQVAAVTRIIAQGTTAEPTTVAAEQPGLRQPVQTEAPATLTGSTSGVPAYAPPSIATASIDTPPAAAPAAPPAWQTTIAPVTVATAPATASPDAGDRTRRQLARDLQAELKRVGCYRGAVDGSWTAASRAAMQSFVERVNASLPTREPDVILLTLVRGHQTTVCGTECAPGQTLAGGRCRSRDIVASADPAALPVTRPVATAAPVEVKAPPAPLPGRMSIGGPKPELTTPPTPAAPVTGERLPWLDNSGTVSKPADPASQHLAALDSTPVLRRAPQPVTSSAVAAPNPLRAAPPRRAIRPLARARPAPVKSAAQQRQAQKRRYATRSVQQLFLHPLGRM